MTKPARSSRRDAEADDAWKAALEGDREAFQAAVRPYLSELLRGARHEVRYRVALGDFRADDPTADEVVGEVLIRAWQERRDRTSSVRLRVWLLALLYRVAHNLSRREARQKRIPAEPLEEPAPAEPIYDDDEEFWECEMMRWEDVVEAPMMTLEEKAGIDEELTRTLDPRAREIFLLCELHRVPLTEAALAPRISVEEAARRLQEARRERGRGQDRNLI